MCDDGTDHHGGAVLGLWKHESEGESHEVGDCDGDGGGGGSKFGIWEWEWEMGWNDRQRKGVEEDRETVGMQSGAERKGRAEKKEAEKFRDEEGEIERREERDEA